jgi:AcrR family transcriptional regulator
MARQGLDTAQVVEAAATLCDLEGWESLNLQALALKLGVRPPSLYNHIAGLPALRRALARLALRELRDRFLLAAAGKSGAAGVRALAKAYRDFARERPGLYSGVLSASPDDDADAQELSKQLIEVMAAVMAPYGLDGDELIHVIRALRAAMHGFIALEVAQGFGLPQSLDESYDRLLELLITGIAAASRRRLKS